MSQPKTKFDTAYEWKAVLLLFLGFGLVGLDRWVIAPLAPQITQDLGMTTGDIANIMAVLGLTWGVFTIVAGNLSDRFGRRNILLPALLIFSLMSGVSGAMSGLYGFIVIRAIMGATEGGFLSTSVALTGEASHPLRRGRNQGIQLSSFSLFGLALGPIIATQLLAGLEGAGVEHAWRWVFVIVAVPGFILAYFMYRIIREPAHLRDRETRRQHAARDPNAPRASLLDVLKNRNILVAMLGILCGMCGIFVLAGLMSLYLTNYLQLPSTEMGFVMAGIGWGGFSGSIIVPAISDYVGRRWTSAVSFAIAFVLLYLFTRTGAQPVQLFALLFGISFFGSSIISLLTGPVAVESVPPLLQASAIGLISGAGEIFNAGGTSFAGFISDNYGIQYVPVFSMICVGLGAIVCLGLRETAPRCVRDEVASEASHVTGN